MSVPSSKVFLVSDPTSRFVVVLQDQFCASQRPAAWVPLREVRNNWREKVNLLLCWNKTVTDTEELCVNDMLMSDAAEDFWRANSKSL